MPLAVIDGPLGGVQLATFVGQEVGIGMSVAAIGVARQFAGQHGLGLLGRFAAIDARQMDRRRQRLGRRLRRDRRGAGQRSSIRFAMVGQSAGKRCERNENVHSIAAAG